MEFKIQNENRLWVVYSFCSMLLIFPAMMLQNAFAIGFVFILVVAVIISNVLNSSVKTTIRIDGDVFSVRHVIGTKYFNINDISDFCFDHYTQTRKQGKYSYYKDYRVELRIFVNGKALKFTDRACTLEKPKSFWSNEYESIPIPDEEVQLYQLYTHLRNITGR